MNKARPRGHQNEIFDPHDGYWPLRGRRSALSRYIVQIRGKNLTKIFGVVYSLCENKRQKEIRFYLFCVYK